MFPRDSNDLPWAGGAQKFSDPFFMPSSEDHPTELRSALDFCLFLYFLNPQYRRATERLVSHFVTDFDFVGKVGGKQERESWGGFIREDLRINSVWQMMGNEWACYGNSFWWMYFPFDRYLLDTRDGDHTRRWALSMFPETMVKFSATKMEYTVPDPIDLRKGIPLKHAGKVSFPFQDIYRRTRDGIKLRRLDPQKVTIRHSWASGKNTFIYRFDEAVLSDLRKGVLHQVNDMPEPMLRAACNKQDFLFNADEVFHFAAPTVSGISLGGWGLPETMANFRMLHRVQVLTKINEVVGRDYMLPFRVFAPDLRGGQMSDSAQLDLMDTFAPFTQQMINTRRKDPYAMFGVPFPIELHEFGMEGKELVTHELLEAENTNMLDAIGIPMELYRGSMQVQSVPTALRSLEASFNFLPAGFNQMLRWVVRRVAAYNREAAVGTQIQLPRMADDIEQRHIFLQLAASGEISRETAYGAFKIQDPVEEATKKMREDVEIQKRRDALTSELQREQAAGNLGSPQPAADGSAQGDPNAPTAAVPGGAAPTGAAASTPLDLEQRARQLSAEWLNVQSDGQRTKMMSQVRATTPQLYALAKQYMEEARSQGASAGRAQASQFAGGGAPA